MLTTKSLFRRQRRLVATLLFVCVLMPVTARFAVAEPAEAPARETPESSMWAPTAAAEPWLYDPGAVRPSSPEFEAAQAGGEFGPLDTVFRTVGRLLAPILDVLGLGAAQRDPSGGPARPAGEVEIELYANEVVQKFMRIYLNSHREAFARGLERAGQYIPMIHRVFEEEGMPLDLAYLAIVESNLDPRALSPKRAAGLWQFMWATAQRFGLRVEPWYDERLDPVLSTRAAARFLRYLHDKFGNWELALAAYNAGEGRVFRAMRASREEGSAEDFWNLSLPTQTRRYVPSFLAVALIYNDLESFGFEPLESEAFLAYEEVRGEFHTSLAEIGRRIGYPEDVLRELNPAWKQGLIPPVSRSDVLLRLPPGGKLRLHQAMATAPLAAPELVSHRVSGGETLSGIARRYAVPMRVLASVNGIADHDRLRRGQTLLVPLSAARRPPETREI